MIVYSLDDLKNDLAGYFSVPLNVFKDMLVDDFLCTVVSSAERMNVDPKTCISTYLKSRSAVNASRVQKIVLDDSLLSKS